MVLFLKEIKRFFNKNQEEGKGNNTYRNIILLGMLGVSLLLFANVFLNDRPSPYSVNQSLPVVKEIQTELTYGEKWERELEEIIALSRGVGKVKVKLFIEMTAFYEYEYNQNQTNKITSETDQNGGERRIEEKNTEQELVIIEDGSGSEKPVIKKRENPVITGVLIVAEGAEISSIKYEIVRAVSSLLNLPIHKISVLPYERG